MGEYLVLGGVVLLRLIGFLGCIIPVIPGPVIAFGAVILLHFTTKADYSWSFFLIGGIVHSVVIVLDTVFPTLGAKKYGGSKRGVRGSALGALCGVVLFPLLGIVIGPFGVVGIIVLPFVGAYLAELLHHHDTRKALRSARGTSVGFLGGIVVKLVVTIRMGVYIGQALLG